MSGPTAYESHPLAGVRTRRALNQISAAKVAAELGIEPQSYGRLERGERRCYLDKAYVIASILGCTLEELGREPSIEERVELYRAGEKRRDLLARADGDEKLAAALSQLQDDDWSAPAPQPSPTTTPSAPAALTEDDQLAQTAKDILASWDDEPDPDLEA